MSATSGIEPWAWEAATLADVLHERARLTPDRRALVFHPFRPDRSEEESVTYAGLERRAAATAARLAERCRPGDRVALLLPPGLDYVAGFLGCFYGGFVAVPLYLPLRGRLTEIVHAAVGGSGARAALAAPVDARELSALDELHAAFASLAVEPIAAEPVANDGAAAAPPRAWPAGAPAYLQYTSGSSGRPKGVRVTHRNLLANLRALSGVYGLGADDRIVSWPPPFHDLGLMSGVFAPLFAGCLGVLLPALAFLQRPSRWLECVSRYRATVSGGPSFAFDLCTRRVRPEVRDGLDLASWEVAFCGAEPVRAPTLARFAEHFAPAGFRREALTPSFGLAEATVFVTGKPRGTPYTVVQIDPQDGAQGLAATGALGLAPPGCGELVGCGVVPPGHRVVVVDPETRVPLDDGRVGEIWVSGPSVADGYWQLAEESAQVFRAQLAVPADDPRASLECLRTGDAGFLRRGELFVTGRLKEMVIASGRNHYAEDIEASVERVHAGIRAGTVAAFGVTLDGCEALVVLAEPPEGDADTAAILERIAGAVADDHDLHPHAVAVVPPGSLPRTSSGKVRRGECRALFLSGLLRTVAVRTAEGPAR